MQTIRSHVRKNTKLLTHATNLKAIWTKTHAQINAKQEMTGVHNILFRRASFIHTSIRKHINRR